MYFRYSLSWLPADAGAIAVTGDSSATIAGQAIFLDNAAGVDGGEYL